LIRKTVLQIIFLNLPVPDCFYHSIHEKAPSGVSMRSFSHPDSQRPADSLLARLSPSDLVPQISTILLSPLVLLTRTSPRPTFLSRVRRSPLPAKCFLIFFRLRSSCNSFMADVYLKRSLPLRYPPNLRSFFLVPFPSLPPEDYLFFRFELQPIFTPYFLSRKHIPSPVGSSTFGPL